MPPNPRPLAILALSTAVLCLPPTAAAAAIARHHARPAPRHAHSVRHHKDKTTNAGRGPLDGGTLYAGTPVLPTGTTVTTPVGSPGVPA